MRYLFIAISALILTTTNAAAQTVRDLLKDTIKTGTLRPSRSRSSTTFTTSAPTGSAVYLLTSPQGHILIDLAMPEATADRGEYPEAGYQARRHQPPPQHPRSHGSHRRTGAARRRTWRPSRSREKRTSRCWRAATIPDRNRRRF